MSMMKVVLVGCLALVASVGCEDPCFDAKPKYDCNCTATCNGQPVTSHSTACEYDRSDALESAKSSCARELAACPNVSCSCSCTEIGDCGTNQCH